MLFLIQVLPVEQWVANCGENKILVEMADGLDPTEKTPAEKDKENDLKEKVVVQNQRLNSYLFHKINRQKNNSSQRAVILHHAEVSAPPPDLT